MKLRKFQQPNQFQYMIMCPGCNCGHGLRVGQSDGPSWTFSGNMEKPTFTPSLLVTMSLPQDKKGLKPDEFIGRCHSYITDGMIQFLPDCTHALAGQTVPLPDF